MRFCPQCWALRECICRFFRRAKKREAFASRFILVDLHSIIANIFPVTETYIFADFPFLRNDKHSFVYNPEINSSAHRQGNPDLSHAPFT